jgi:hypothetical protein
VQVAGIAPGGSPGIAGAAVGVVSVAKKAARGAGIGVGAGPGIVADDGWAAAAAALPGAGPAASAADVTTASNRQTSAMFRVFTLTPPLRECSARERANN